MATIFFKGGSLAFDGYHNFRFNNNAQLNSTRRPNWTHQGTQIRRFVASRLENCRFLRNIKIQ